MKIANENNDEKRKINNQHLKWKNECEVKEFFALNKLNHFIFISDLLLLLFNFIYYLTITIQLEYILKLIFFIISNLISNIY